MNAVGASLVPWEQYGRRGGVAFFSATFGTMKAWLFWASFGRPGGIARHLGPIWPPSRRGPPTGPRMAAVGAWTPRAAIWPPWGRDLSPGLRLAAVGRGGSPGLCTAAVGAWLVPYAPYYCRGGVAHPLGPVWQLWGRGLYPEPRMAASGVWPNP